MAYQDILMTHIGETISLTHKIYIKIYISTESKCITNINTIYCKEWRSLGIGRASGTEKLPGTSGRLSFSHSNTVRISPGSMRWPHNMECLILTLANFFNYAQETNIFWHVRKYISGYRAFWFSERSPIGVAHWTIYHGGVTGKFQSPEIILSSKFQEKKKDEGRTYRQKTFKTHIKELQCEDLIWNMIRTIKKYMWNL